MDKHHITPSQIERLSLLAEECAEVSQVVSKVLRFGWGGNTEKHDNVEHLEQEIADLQVVIKMLANNQDISLKRIEEKEEAKVKRLKKYLIFNTI